jgi:hypothetical protein
MALGAWGSFAQAQNFRYQPKPRAGTHSFSYAGSDAAPRLLSGTPSAERLAAGGSRGYLYPRRGTMVDRMRYDQPTPASRPAEMGEAESIPPGMQVQPFSEDVSGDMAPRPPRESETFYDEGYDEGFEREPFMQQGYVDPYLCDECGASYCEILRCLCACLKKSYLYSPSMWRNFGAITGVQGFKGPADLGVNGNFGFNKSINWATPFWNAHGIGHQLGATVMFSDFEGSNGPLGSSRTQFFLTTGLFRRPKYDQGFQGGAVLDYLHDNFYVTMELLQIRAEMSYLWDCNEIGFWGAFHLNNDSSTVNSVANLTQISWAANNQYNLFYRRNFGNGLNYRMWVGLTDYADVLFGGDCTAQISQRWSLMTSSNYLLPTSTYNGLPKNTTESFNLGINLVWYPFAPKCDPCPNRYRPLFGVADNGTMMTRTY